jgi:adenylyl-sulfate kinase
MDNLFPPVSALSNDARRSLMGQNPMVIWFTGLSGAGKTTLALLLENQLNERGFKSFRLDGDHVRKGLCSDLGFLTSDRTENVRRVAEVAALMKDAGLITIVSLISPLKSDRELARRISGIGFMEVFVDCTVEECIRRDVKGLYAKAQSGAIAEFTGISASYEKPENPDLILNTDKETPSSCVQQLLAHILPLITHHVKS